MLAAGSVMTEDGEIPPKVLAAGALAETKKELDGSSAKWIEGAAHEYQALRLRYMEGAGSTVTGTSGEESTRSAE
jgi:carbonic anhydrase/acetyltransferase-like protein (isoleucine patch superfamily)